jgi:hypothetical protein
MRSAQRAFTLAFGIAITALSSPAMAQGASTAEEPSDEEMARARDLFATGLSHIEDARWADALEVFRECYELTANPVALYNVALSLRALGRNVEARDVFEILDSRHAGELPADLHPAAEQMRDEVQARIAILELVGLSADAQPLIIRVDGRERDVRGPPFEVAVDEGHRRLLVESEAEGRYAWEGSVEPGQRLALDVELEEESSGIPWWVFAGAGGLVAVGVVILVVVLTAPETPQYDSMVEL